MLNAIRWRDINLRSDKFLLYTAMAGQFLLVLRFISTHFPLFIFIETHV